MLTKKEITGLTAEAMNLLMNYHWSDGSGFIFSIAK